MVDPVVEAAPLERIVELAGAVGGEDDDRRDRRLDGAELGDRDLPGGEHLEQERLELVVRAVDLVDEQQGRALLEGGQDRPGQQEPLVVQALLGLLGVGTPTGLERPQVQDLAREVPVVERLGGVDALVALEPHQRQLQRLGEGLGERGLAGPGLPLEQQRPLHPERQVGDRGELVVAQVSGPAEQAGHVGGGRRLHRFQATGPAVEARRSHRPGRLTRSAASAPSPSSGTGVEVATGGEIAALDQLDVMSGQVVACAAVSSGGLQDSRPVVAAEQDRMPRHAVVRRPREDVR